MSGPTYRLVNATRGSVVAERIRCADRLYTRLVGLIGKSSLTTGEGLWLVPCNGIHTFGLRFPLDVLALDRDARVVRRWDAVPSGRILQPVRGGHSVVEVRGGTLNGVEIQIGDRLEFERHEDA